MIGLAIRLDGAIAARGWPLRGTRERKRSARAAADRRRTRATRGHAGGRGAGARARDRGGTRGGARPHANWSDPPGRWRIRRSRRPTKTSASPTTRVGDGRDVDGRISSYGSRCRSPASAAPAQRGRGGSALRCGRTPQRSSAASARDVAQLYARYYALDRRAEALRAARESHATADANVSRRATRPVVPRWRRRIRARLELARLDERLAGSRGRAPNVSMRN